MNENEFAFAELRPLESDNKNGQKTTEVLDIEVDTPSPAFITKEAIMSVSEIRPAVEPSSYANANANANGNANLPDKDKDKEDVRSKRRKSARQSRNHDFSFNVT